MKSRRQLADSVMAAYPRHTLFNNDIEGYSPYFSHSECELCECGAGDRYKVSAVITGLPNSEKEQVDFEVCADCMYYVAYGEGPPEYFEGEEEEERQSECLTNYEINSGLF